MGPPAPAQQLLAALHSIGTSAVLLRPKKSLFGSTHRTTEPYNATEEVNNEDEYLSCY